MRTKTLVLGTALAAAIATSAVAQSNVYSLNVVGYINVPLAANTLKLISNPLDNGTNTLDGVAAALPNKSTAQIWNGAGFTTSTKGAGGWSPNFALPVGTAFFVSSFNAAVTNTFVGQVIVGPGGKYTNALTPTLVMVGSPIPYAGPLDDTNINLSSLPNKSTVQTWNGAGFTTATKGAGGWSPNTPLAVADGFFVSAFSPVNWVQTLPAN